MMHKNFTLRLWIFSLIVQDVFLFSCNLQSTGLESAGIFFCTYPPFSLYVVLNIFDFYLLSFWFAFCEFSSILFSSCRIESNCIIISAYTYKCIFQSLSIKLIISGRSDRFCVLFA